MTYGLNILFIIVGVIFWLVAMSAICCDMISFRSARSYFWTDLGIIFKGISIIFLAIFLNMWVSCV